MDEFFCIILRFPLPRGIPRTCENLECIYEILVILLENLIVVYNDVVDKEKKMTIRLWVSKEYEGEVENNSFNIKINPGQES